MQTGWIGLGKLGAPMARHLARHLVAAGYPVLALDRDPGRLAAVPGPRPPVSTGSQPAAS